ncbi:MAG: asparagine synthase (glutamine-hydrolyzing) [Candidatus Sericytochromatia bacterium]|nr:asparagine synthase (glutamine-hydrolyzing) [Candidatus Sericytochromatia bacterium]
MCGIVGVLGRHATPEVAAAMAARIAHRGPDDQGVWADPEAQLALGHVRLSIVDLSPAGHQPMASAGGRLVLSFNGEIYNHLALREALAAAGQAPAWRGRSDTETLLAAFEAWGVRETLTRCVGMFAFALWDRVARTLTLARDRLGEKPLYYGHQGGALVVGSELAALRAHPGFEGRVDRGSLALLLRHGYIPAPWSIHEGVRKLPPGTTLTVQADGSHGEPAPYWDARDVVEAGLADPFSGSPDEAVDELERLLTQAVEGQLMGDVPVGAFLSGGIDSSTVAALMRRLNRGPVRTFSIGFQEDGYDEAQHARAVAAHLGTDHTELYVTPADALAVIPRLPALYSEPFADSSQLPTFLVSALARRQVTVSLSGDAGDELFGGYSRYQVVDAAWRQLGQLPAAVRRLTAAAITGVPMPAWNAALRPARRLLPARWRDANMGDKLHRGAALLGISDRHALYHHLVSTCAAPEAVVVGAREHLTTLTSAALRPSATPFFQEMMAADMVTYLPDDILCKVDRAAMGVSLETRVPFLDHRVVEFAWRLPLAYKVRDGVGKWVLRQVLHRHVPPTLVERPKMGFGVPIHAWLQGPLREWAEALLAPERLRQEGFFEPTRVRARWEGHLSGRVNAAYEIWHILMFQAWLENNRGPHSPTVQEGVHV